MACAALCVSLLLGCEPAPEHAADVCSPPRATAAVPDVLGSASGVAISRRHAGILWMVNNTEPVGRIFAVDTAGAVVGIVHIPHSRNVDWEDLELASCGDEHCLYIADIGDNLHQRSDVGFYRVREPAPNDSLSSTPEWFPVHYPSGPQDAEALFVMPDEDVYIISKGRNRAISIFRYPAPLRPGIPVELEEIQQLSDGVVQLPDMVTGAAATLDGSVVAVRTYTHLQLFRLGGRGLEPLLDGDGLDLLPLAEPQGEGVDIREDGWIVLTGERGPSTTSPPLGSIRCRIP